MKNKLLKVILFTYLIYTFTNAQEAESFFPHNVGDRWEYVDNWGNLTVQTITRDSIGPDGSHNLFNYYSYPNFRIDTLLNVFERPQSPNWNYLLYKLNADTGEVWENPQSGGGRWAWVTRIETAYVFSELTVIKIFRYGPGYDGYADSRGLLENWLASGFGLIYSESESGFSYLTGCIVAGDTFGILTSVEDIDIGFPADFELKQNYPNPFNPTTTIEYKLPHEAEININIYDILGQHVIMLYNGWKPSGNYKIQWDATGFASGIYLCRIRTNKETKTIKMILSK